VNKVDILETVKITNKRVKPFDGKKRYLATGNLSNQGIDDFLFVDYENKPSRADLMVSNGDLILARMKATNKVFLIDCDSEDLIVSTGFLTLKPRDGFDGGYLYHYFRSRTFQRLKDKYCSGATQKAINNSSFKELKVPYYEIAQQKKIVQILDKADNLRQKRKEQLALLDDYLKSVFLDMFGDPVINPKKWPIKELGKVGDLDRGISKNRPRNAPELLGGSYPLIQTGDVSNSRGYIKEFRQTYSELGLMQSKMWPIGTLCITIAANIAKTGILTFEACFPDSVVGFTPNNLVKTEYVQWWMVFLQKILEEKAPESAQKNINLGILRVLDIPVPPIELQDKFVSIVDQVEQTKQKMRDSLDEMDNHFNALMQRYFV